MQELLQRHLAAYADANWAAYKADLADNATYEEIATVTNTELGTVKSRINRGRAQLQALLKDLYSELFPSAE